MNSAITRHHYRRLQKSRKHYWFGREYGMTAKESGQVANTPHPCSCLGCGNARKIEGPTRQERKFYVTNARDVA